MNKKVELLSPAGSIRALKAGVSAGADAIYIGGKKFGARAFADNPDMDALIYGIDYAHIHGKKIYLTVNTLIKDSEISDFIEYLSPYYSAGIDAVIIQDLGLIEVIKTAFPELSLHASTQMSITSKYGAELLKSSGVERIVPARELSLAEIKEIYDNTGLEIECFIHGAMCYAYSGQCLFSSMLGGRSGNRGQCAQPCRLPYSVNNGKSKDVLSMKDLCTIDLIPALINAGIASFKIEGRMKSTDYVYEVVKTYRKYIDKYYDNGDYVVEGKDKDRLLNVYRRRGYTTGYYYKQNGSDMISLTQPNSNKENTAIDINKDYEQKLEIEGRAYFRKNTKSKFVLQYEATCISVCGEEVQEAKKQPLALETVSTALSKTGTTDFEFKGLSIDLDDNVFMTIKQLNTLRRDALAALKEELLSMYRREGQIGKTDENEKTDKSYEAGKPKVSYTASVQTKEQLLAAASSDCIERIYVESDMLFDKLNLSKYRSGSKEIFAAFPYIFRQKYEKRLQEILKTSDNFDGILIRNLEELAWLKKKEYKGRIISDYSLYSFNNFSAKYIMENGADMLTAPAELNRYELSDLDIKDMELIGYGLMPLMITANCVSNTVSKCSHSSDIINIKDRYNKIFPVKNCCEYCYNVIYNSVPLVLTGEREAILKLKPKALRLMFTDETRSEAENIINGYYKAFSKGLTDELSIRNFTKGHFKRGVN